MIIPVPYRWGLIIAHIKWQKEFKRFYGVINAEKYPIAFTTKHFFKIMQAARWSWAAYREHGFDK